MFLDLNLLVRGVRQYLIANPKNRQRRKRGRRQISLQPRLEALECRLTPATYTVNVTTDNGSFLVGQSTGAMSGDLRFAIAQADAHPGSTIEFSLPTNNTITLSTALEPIDADMTIDGSHGGSVTISGGGTSRIFFVTAGNVNIDDLTIADGLAVGGAGGSGGDASGGGGAGIGGGLLINGGTVLLTLVNFTNDHAQGGAGGNSSGASFVGGGGGAGGSGGEALEGGGGGGFLGAGGSGGATSGAPGAGGGGGFTGSGGAGGGTTGMAGGNGLSMGGGGGGGDIAAGGLGSPDGGGNGTATDTRNGSGGGGGSSGFTGSSSGQSGNSGGDGDGGAGGFGGGGGGAQFTGGMGGDYGGGGGGTFTGGQGGFGGGGGGGKAGGQGGFGGGGGGGEFTGGAAGTFGGEPAESGGAGSGAGLGGAIFLRAGALTLSNTTFTDDSSRGGVPGDAAGAGAGKAGAIFINSGASAVSEGSAPIFSGNSAGAAGTSSTDNVNIFGSLIVQGASLDVKPSFLTYTASSGINNDLTLSATTTDYSLNDTAETISLTLDAVNAGWTLSPDGHTATGPIVGVPTGNFEISLGDDVDTFNVQNTPNATPVNAMLEGINVVAVNVGNAGSVQGILGALTLSNPEGFNDVTVDDSADTAAQTAILTAAGGTDTITGLAPATINYFNFETSAIAIDGGSGGNTFNMQSDGTVPTAINSGSGNDIINVSSNAPTNTGDLSGLGGTLTIDAGAGSNTLAVSASGSVTVNEVMHVTGSEISSTVVPFTINYSATSGTYGTIDVSSSGAISLDGGLTATGTVAVTSTAKSITNGAGVGTDVISGNLSLSAATGIGASGVNKAITTEASGLVAQNTTAGSIFISNSGNPITIGYTGDPFQGVLDTGATNSDSVVIQTDAGDLTVNQAIDAGAAGIHLVATGEVNVNANVTGNSVAIFGNASSGTGVSFGTGAVLDADSQSYLAGNGTGTASINFANATFNNSAGSGTPTDFTVIQDATINDSEPTASQYFGNTPPTNLTLQSDNGGVTINTAASVAGSNLTLTTELNTIQGQIDINTGLTLASLSVSVPTGITAIVSLSGVTITTTTAAGQSYSGALTLNGNPTLDASAGNGGVTIDDGVTGHSFPSSVLTVKDGSGASSISGVVKDGFTGTTGLTISGGAVTLNGSNGYSGTTTINNGATLKFGNTDAASTFSAVTDNGTLELNSFAETIPSFAGTWTIINTGGGSNLFDITGSASFGGTATAGALTVGGATAFNTSSITTTGAQDYTSGVTLGVSPGSTVQFITTSSTVTVGGNLMLGATASTATDTLQITGALSFADSSTLTSTFAGVGLAQFGHVSVSNSTNFNSATLALNYASFSPAPGNSFDVVSNGASPTGQFNNAMAPGPVTLGGVAYLVTYSGNGGNDFILSFGTPPMVNSPTFSPPPPGNFTATLGGDVTSDGGAPILERGVMFAKTAANLELKLGVAGVTEVDDAAMTIGVFADSASALAAGTSYSFVAFATNAAGTAYTSGSSPEFVGEIVKG